MIQERLDWLAEVPTSMDALFTSSCQPLHPRGQLLPEANCSMPLIITYSVFPVLVEKCKIPQLKFTPSTGWIFAPA